jgi:hypothetical protein
MFVTCATEEQGERLRRAGYNVTVISSGATPPRRPRQTPAASDDPKVIDDLLADLRSSAEGRRLGRQFGHDARILARHLGLPVAYVPLDSLQRGQAGINRGVLKRYPGGGSVVELANVLNGHETQKVLAHECAHFLGFASERYADQFSAAFMKVDEDETAAGRWAIMRRELLAKARRRAAQHAH